ncbi:MAG: serine/threonine-protein kinase [Planctomycetes bacterium]|nr:serine/threonine-protein kinase [Planctomycetota bacterium]
MNNTNATINDLIGQWEDARERGEHLTVEELCRDYPEHREAVRKQIAALMAFDSFLEAETTPHVQATAATSLPTTISGYEIIQVLGRGGMGIVYKARQLTLDRIVALKMILAAEHAGSELRLRFRREAEAVARLRHPGIVQIYDVGTSPNGDYLAMEYVEGGSLADQLNGTPWKANDAASLLVQLAEAIEEAHRNGIVHRDLKPANILLTAGREEKAIGTWKPSEESRTNEKEKGLNETAKDATTAHTSSSTSSTNQPTAYRCKITDFGIAKRLDEANAPTVTGAILGTPSYMAPEQASGTPRAIGPATDVYALGSILYELLVGRPPFKAATAIDTIRQVIDDEPVPVSRINTKVPRDLETIVLKCLLKDPSRRYASAREFADDLRRFLNGEPIHARPVGFVERGIKWAKRRPAAAALVVVSVLGLAALIVGGWWYNSRLSEALDDKNQSLVKEQKALKDKNELLEKEQKTAADLSVALSDKTVALKEKNESLIKEQKSAADLAVALKDKDKELDRTQRLYGESNRYTRWILNEHMVRLSGLRGGIVVQKTLVERIRVYLDRLASEVVEGSHLNSDLTTIDIAIAYERLANVQGHPNSVNYGDTKAALINYDKSLALRQGLLAKDPNDAKVCFGHASCLRRKGDVLALTGASSEARKAYDVALKEVLALLKAQPDDPAARAEEFTIRIGMADLVAPTDRKSALAQFEEILSASIKAFGAKTKEIERISQRVVLHCRIGDLLETDRQFEPAMKQYEQAADLIRDEVKRMPEDVRMQSMLSTSLISLGDLLSFLGKPDEAMKNYQLALEIRRAQQQADADSRSTAHALCIALERVASSHTLKKQHQLALPLLTEALDKRKRIHEADPLNVEFARGLWIVHGQLGETLRLMDNLTEAELHALEQKKLAQTLADRLKVPGDLQGVAEAEILLSQIVFRKAKVDGPLAEVIALYQKSSQHAIQAVAIFNRMGKLGELNAKQKRLRTDAQLMANSIDQAIEKLKKLKD